MEVKKYFCAKRGLIGATRRYALPSQLHIATTHKWIHMALHTMCPLPSIFLDPPLYTEIFSACNSLLLSAVEMERVLLDLFMQGCHVHTPNEYGCLTIAQ